MQILHYKTNNHNCFPFEGGKWTTYRSMAEETVDRAVKECGLKPTSGCRTKGLLLDGAHGYSPTLFIRLVQDFGLENEVRFLKKYFNKGATYVIQFPCCV